MGASTAFAIAGLGGNNAHGQGFLAAMQHVARRDGHTTGIPPDLRMISCTSGAIAATASYLQGKDLRVELQDRIDAVNRVTGLPSAASADPLRAAAITLWTGVPGVFGPSTLAYGQHLLQQAIDLPRAAWRSTGPSLDDVLNLLLPARMFVPELPDSFFEQTARTFNEAPIGVVCNSFDPRNGVEYLYVNGPGLQLITDHEDSTARYDAVRERTAYRPTTTVYKEITPGGLRDALWLFYYGFPEGQGSIDGAYGRAVILDELTFADRIWVAKPINDRWLGPLPKNLLEVLDLQTKLWMDTSYREQTRAIRMINKLGDSGRQALREASSTEKRYHPIQLNPIEIEIARGFFTYFVEDITVFDRAYKETLAAVDDQAGTA